MYGHVPVSAIFCGSGQEGIRSPGVAVSRSFELPSVGAGRDNQIQALCKNIKYS